MKNICKMLSLFLVSILVFSISFGINADKKASASEALRLVLNDGGTYKQEVSARYRNSINGIFVTEYEQGIFNEIGTDNYFVKGYQNVYVSATKHIFNQTNSYEQITNANLQDETKNEIIGLLNNNIESVTVFSMSTPYIGYNNMMYMNEQIIVKNGDIDNYTVTNSINWGAIIAMKVLLKIAGGPGTSTLSFVITLASFANNTFNLNDPIKYKIDLHENKILKKTYILQDGAYQYGSSTEFAKVTLKNVFERISDALVIINDYKAEYKTSSYNNAEQHCFMHVAYGGHKERVSYYEIDGERIDSTFAIHS